jgi:hypothetical protein
MSKSGLRTFLIKELKEVLPPTLLMGPGVDLRIDGSSQWILTGSLYGSN